MPIFISYSHQDAEFVENLAKNLAFRKHHIWIDRWELNVGDSLTERIEAALTDASAVLVVLSQSSTSSNWCRRELTAGLLRELEEKNTLVLPIVVDDCQIPLFLRDKLYADFRTDPDKAMELVDRSLSRYSNPAQSKFESPEFHTDWSVEWSDQKQIGWMFRWTFVDHGANLPYVVLCECEVLDPNHSGEAFLSLIRNDTHMEYIFSVLTNLVEQVKAKPLSGMIKDTSTSLVMLQTEDPHGNELVAMYTYRRLGLDNGFDTLVHLDNNLIRAHQHMAAALGKTA